MSALYPFSPHWLDVGEGVRMHYVDEGPRSADPVLMVHGNPSWSFYYRNLVTALSGTHRAIALDHVGCGRSDKPEDARYDYTLQRRVDDLGRLVEHLGLKRITLVVHDWGGMIGMAWAAKHPKLISRLVILNTAAFHLPSGKTFPPTIALARSPLLGEALVRGGNAFVRGAIRYCVTRRPMTREIAAGYREPYDSWKNRIAVQRFVEDIPLRPTDRSYAILEETAAGLEALRDKPMLVGWGMRDFVFDHHFLAEWERRFPDADVHRFEDCGHYVLEDAADELIPLIQRFIDAHPLEATA